MKDRQTEWQTSKLISFPVPTSLFFTQECIDLIRAISD